MELAPSTLGLTRAGFISLLSAISSVYLGFAMFLHSSSHLEPALSALDLSHPELSLPLHSFAHCGSSFLVSGLSRFGFAPSIVDTALLGFSSSVRSSLCSELFPLASDAGRLDLSLLLLSLIHI